MIYTFTLNPAIDLVMQFQSLNANRVNRSLGDDIQENGKGVNVSIVLKTLGIESIATGFIAGFTGYYIRDCLEKRDISTHFIEIDGITRINVFATLETENCEYKMVNKGPVVNMEAQQRLLDWCQEHVTQNDIVCLSGSLPDGVDPQFIKKLVEVSRLSGAKVILDTSSAVVLECLPLGIWLIKPNTEELSEWIGKPINDRRSYIEHAKTLLQLGADNVLLSLGEEGAIFLSEESVYYGNAPKGKVRNTAGAGDTLLATFIASLIQNKSVEDSLKLAISAGSSTAFRIGLTNFSDVETLMTQVTIKQIEE